MNDTIKTLCEQLRRAADMLMSDSATQEDKRLMFRACREVASKAENPPKPEPKQTQSVPSPAFKKK